MANGEICTKCGQQEAKHDMGEAFIAPHKPCDGFVSEFTHHEDCPVIGCDGDCETFIERERLRKEREWAKFQH